MENIIKYLQLYFTKGLGNKSIKALIDYFGAVDNIYNSSFEEISKIAGKKTASLVLEESKKNKEKAEKELLKAEKHKIKIITYEAKEYPENLRNIPDPPPVLYVKGNLPDNFCISIVGTRKPTNYGKKIAYIISKHLIENNICIVSGGAYGVDSIAHKTAIENKGKTVAVLGTGLDISYPTQNKKLFEKISQNGALISEFPIGTKPSKFNFPLRNRIVAGISEATVVIEAPEKSGSLITAKLANEYGKPVFAVPSNIDNINAKGCNILIKEGAIPVVDSNTMLEELPYLKSKVSKIIVSLSEEEENILNFIEQEIYLDELIEKSGFEFNEILNLIFQLEMKGLIKNENGLIRKLTF